MCLIENLEDEVQLVKIRHSLAHILAQAVLDLRPGSSLGFGPATDDGFYYDFMLSSPITHEDFSKIEKKMKFIIKQHQVFEQEDVPVVEALSELRNMNQPYKLEYAQELVKQNGLAAFSFYSNGPFRDFCEGPHVGNTKEISLGAFKLKGVAGAYWRGNSKNVMMTRIYGWAFRSKSELETHLKDQKTAQERDHKKLGKVLEIFCHDSEIGPGLPLWLPNGTVIRDELENLAKDLEFEAGYQRVSTPSLTKKGLYLKSGHLPYYEESMFPFIQLHSEEQDCNDEDSYVLRPMNCPHHHRIFSHKKRSYKELPIRLAEYGTVYRNESSGSLSGLTRVRCMTMNDAHIYCTKDQVKHEFKEVMKMHLKVYTILGLSNYHFRLSTWDPESAKGQKKFVNDPKSWAYTQRVLREVMEEIDAPYQIGKGEAAFYGPKIDVQFTTVSGKEETASTCQLDFAVPARMNLRYMGRDNQEHTPYVIHRAPLGTHERFIAFLIEHYNGVFPTWLAPIQVRLITVSNRFNNYAEEVLRDLRRHKIRAELEAHNDSLSKKMRNAHMLKIPNILIIGENEVTHQSVTLRKHGVKTQEEISVAALVPYFCQLIEQRQL